MVRLGFWPAARPLPTDSPEETREMQQLQARIRALQGEQTRLHNVEAMLKEARKRRMAESRQRREETKRRRLQLRLERAERWQERKQRELLYVGPGVSSNLKDHACDEARLQAQNLPVLGDPAALAAAMGITVPELRFLTFHRKVSHITHYRRFLIPKKTGGQRAISAPMPRLKAAQRWVLEHLLLRVPAHDAAHGFLPARSIVTNARPHVGAAVVVNLDLKDFFPTITLPRVWGLFKALGYSRAVASLLALLCTEPEVVTVELDGRTWQVARSERRLPQGAPSSPAITNLLCRNLDRRLARIAEMSGFTYTRYADDLTFSAPAGDAAQQVGALLARVHHVVHGEGFAVHPDKTRVLRRGRQQEVTGVVVNDKLSIDRKELKRFRATLFQVERDGLAGKRWGQSDDLIAALEGYANFVLMVDPDKGRPLKARVAALIERYGYGSAGSPAQRRARYGGPKKATSPTTTTLAMTAPAPTSAPSPEPPAPEPPAEASDNKKWWKLW
jgi:retron-type reverse transcriptase